MRPAYSLIVVSCILFSSGVLAAYDSSQLNTLFTDKKQRAQLDASRSGHVAGKVSPKSNKVKIKGYITRSDGKSVVWVNNKNTLKSSRVDNVKVNHSSVGKDNSVMISVDGKSKRLKPGETWHTTTGKVVENR